MVTQLRRPVGASTPSSGGAPRSMLVWVVGVVALVGAVTASASVGSLAIDVATVWRVIAFHALGVGDPEGWSRVANTVVWDIRLPRTLLAVLVGAAMSLAGVGTQALVHNPLGDPYVLGVAQGASTAAVAVMVAGAGSFGGLSAGAAAFIGALVTLIAVYAFACRGGGLGALRLVLSGVAVGYALSGVTSYLVLQADNPATTSSVLFWLLGSLGRAQWSYLGAPALGLVLGMVWLFGRARAMNALQAGEETAASVGIRPGRVRAELFVVIALLTGLMVALCGWIGFVGLIVPHTARLLIGANHRLLLPLAALLGAVFLVLVDLLARMALAPQELPIGVVTSVLGAPAFLLLMARRARDVSGR